MCGLFDLRHLEAKKGFGFIFRIFRFLRDFSRVLIFGGKMECRLGFMVGSGYMGRK